MPSVLPASFQVHHIRSRGRLGDDIDENLVTRCTDSLLSVAHLLAQIVSINCKWLEP
jgi:hypothetical protein